MPENVVELRQVARGFGQIAAVVDVSLQLGPGITGLLGPNGAGKSTLMKLIVGLIRPQRGEVKLFGESLQQRRDLLKQVGYSPEHDGSYDELSGLTLVTLLTQLYGYEKAAAAVAAAALLERLDLGTVMQRPIATYSKGMRQRVKLAQAMVHRPKLLVLDEPMTGCDPLVRQRISAVVRELAQSGTCVVVSSHVLDEIESMTSRIVLINKGRVIAEGDIYAIRQLIDDHPHQIRVGCDAPQQLAQALLAAHKPLALRFEAAALVVETADPDGCYDALPKVAHAAGLSLSELTSPDNNLAAIFRYLTEPQRGKSA